MKRRIMVALLVAATLLGGCERSADSGIPTAGGGTAPGASVTRDILGEMRRWAQCMREHGVDMPDPYHDPETGKFTFGYEGPGKGEPGADVQLAAQEACVEYEKAYQEFDPQPLTEEQLRLFREWAQCMRDHGVDQPDPGPHGFENDDSSTRDPRAQDPQAAVREQADEACFDKFLEARMAGA